MPDMTKPLSHVEDLLERMRFDITRTVEEITKAQARLGVMEEYERRTRLALKDERQIEDERHKGLVSRS